MPLVKINPKRQVTIPKEVITSLRLSIGDVLEMQVKNGKGFFVQKKSGAKTPPSKLSSKEQPLLASAKKKIAALNRNIRTTKGLTEAETKVAAKAGLIDSEQRWWWTEEWQKGERRTQRDIDEGRVSEVYDNVDEALRELKGPI